MLPAAMITAIGASAVSMMLCATGALMVRRVGGIDITLLVTASYALPVLSLGAALRLRRFPRSASLFLLLVAGIHPLLFDGWLWLLPGTLFVSAAVVALLGRSTSSVDDARQR